MVLTETEPQDSLKDFEYYTFKCPACGDTERRLLPRGRVPITKILRSTTATPPPLRKSQEKIRPQERIKPQDKIGKKDDPLLARPRASGQARSSQSSTPKSDPERLNELLKNPKKFIDAFVRGHRTNKPD